MIVLGSLDFEVAAAYFPTASRTDENLLAESTAIYDFHEKRAVDQASAQLPCSPIATQAENRFRVPHTLSMPSSLGQWPVIGYTAVRNPPSANGLRTSAFFVSSAFSFPSKRIDPAEHQCRRARMRDSSVRDFSWRH